MSEPPVQAPAGYRLARRERIPLERVSLAGLASAPLWLLLFLRLARLLGSPVRLRMRLSPTRLLAALGILSAGMPLLHEGAHGVVARLVGARPRYSVGRGFAYTTFEEAVGRDAYLAIGLAPLLALSALALGVLLRAPRWLGQVLTFAVGNAAGAAGDLWVAWRVIKLPRRARIRDLADGFAVFLPDAEVDPTGDQAAPQLGATARNA